VNSLYRCRCRVAYRPYAADYLIVFEERQVANAQINMSWSPDPINMNAEGYAGVTQFVNALTGSTAQVTLTDPYMTGPSWTVLFDTAAAYTNQTAAAAKNILLPKCQPGQDPRRDRCFNYVDLEDPGERGGVLGQFAHILITLYYEVAGVKFSLDTFFRVQGFDISHGKSYPAVTIRGVDPQTISFNQTLSNYQLKENVTLEENLKEIAKSLGHTVSFCNPPGVDYSQEYLMPKNFKERGVTAEEVIRKYVRSVKGTYSKLPIKEYAGKISICTRANVNQGCSVFYLGKGLYEGYNITGGVDPNTLSQNLEVGNANTSYIDDVRAKFEPGTYELNDLAPTRRKEKLKGAKLEPFPKQFVMNDKKLNNGQNSKQNALRLLNSEVDLRTYIDTNMYGIATNGDKSIALLDGKVVGISTDAGRVVIETNYFLRICKKTEPKECFNKVIFQESQKINKIEEVVKYDSKVTLGQKLGGSAPTDPEQLRLFIRGFNASDIITLDPSLVKAYAVPVEGLTDEEKSKAGIKPAQAPSANTPSGPESPVSGAYVGKVGNTGSSTGPHLHAEKFPPGQSGGRGVPVTPAEVDAYVRIGGLPPSSWGISSPYGQTPSRFHNGIDFAGTKNGKDIDGQPITIINGASVIRTGSEPGGYGNFVEIRTPGGYDLLLAHLQDGSTSSVKPGQSSNVSTSSGVSPGVQNSPTAIGAKITTEFMGVPRALRIIPGRTVLNFITRYDEWVEKGRPADIDPGVWIPGRFSKWFVQSVRYNWAQGGLRVQIDGVTDWGATTAKVRTPSFEDYLKDQNFQKGNNYYNYIRSLGDLCYKVDGKDSCREICSEAEELRNFLRSRNNQSGSSIAESSGNFPDSGCVYNGTYLSNKRDLINNIMGMLKLTGINNKFAFAGAIGNLAHESAGLNCDIHNSRSQGVTCLSVNGTPEKCFGLAQWGGARKEQIIAKCKGVNCSCQQQLEFIRQEIEQKTNLARRCQKDFIARMNGVTSADQGADVWDICYEISSKGSEERRQEARKILEGIKCERKA